MTAGPKNSSIRSGPKVAARKMRAALMRLTFQATRTRGHPHPSFRPLHAFAAVGLAVTPLCGCAVGPDFSTPAAPTATAFLPAEASKARFGDQHLAVGEDIPGQWWEAFHSRALTALVQNALAHNADLKAAQAALRSARENGKAQRGILYPQLAANFNPTGGKIADEVASPLASNQDYFSLTTAQLSVAYTPDVFGLNRRQIESADALARVQRFQIEATYLTLTSNLVLAAITEASLRGQIKATENIIVAETDLLKVLRREEALGQVARADVLLQDAALAQAQQTLPPLNKQLGIQRDLITALSGRTSDDQVEETFDLASLELPRRLPVSLPSEMVGHRPDVRAADATLQSTSALIGVAKANRLPVVSLTAEIGSSPANLVRLFHPSTFFYTLAGNVAQTVFDGGTLLHKQRQAEADFDQAYEQYRSTVIVAFQNVADALRAIEADEQAEKAALASRTAAGRSLAVARRQLQLGAISTIVVLSAQQTDMQAELGVIQARAARFSDVVALFQALGGGWWNRSDVPATRDYTLLDSIR